MPLRHNFLIVNLNIFPMNKIRSIALINAFTFLVQAGLFYSIHFQLINQNPVREITDAYSSLLIPLPGMAFKIWGVIYTALAIFCLYHIKMAYSRPEKHTANQDTAHVGIFFIINNLAAAGWLIAVFKGQMLFSLIMLAIQLAALIMIHYRLNIYKRYRRARTNICTQIPLSIYFGWLSMLTIAGINAYLELSSVQWYLIFIGAIIFISLLLVFLRHNIFYGLMIIAGLYGIILKTESLIINNYDITLTAWIGIGILAIGSFIKLVIDFLLKEPHSAIFHRAAYD